ncbi:4-diphosphocytidyl-2C-methyl-D-erythritol synthase [Burkholderiales bacterium]|nr:4-diphosphocytidyl-2C-methyl-D-erythritol synthase [Burkholderiales bacterium]
MKKIFGLIPAAGIGARMRADRPKQYLSLGSLTLLERSVQCLLADARVARVFVVVARDDTLAPSLALPGRCEILFAGGATRAQTVRNGLRAVQGIAAGDDWVLVHDAARPCLEPAELAALIDGGGGDEHGGLLALPVSDTVKRERAGRVAQTVERDGLWRALTPQFFRVDVLARALEQDTEAATITDESAAVERLGLHPRLIAGAPGNIKVTTAPDLLLAEAILRQQGRW